MHVCVFYIFYLIVLWIMRFEQLMVIWLYWYILKILDGLKVMCKSKHHVYKCMPLRQV